jgi:hypothetical protein
MLASIIDSQPLSKDGGVRYRVAKQLSTTLSSGSIDRVTIDAS